LCCGSADGSTDGSTDGLTDGSTDGSTDQLLMNDRSRAYISYKP
jgi:hypothetical protein